MGGGSQEQGYPAKSLLKREIWQPAQIHGAQEFLTHSCSIMITDWHSFHFWPFLISLTIFQSIFYSVIFCNLWSNPLPFKVIKEYLYRIYYAFPNNAFLQTRMFTGISSSCTFLIMWLSHLVFFPLKNKSKEKCNYKQK